MLIGLEDYFPFERIPFQLTFVHFRGFWNASVFSGIFSWAFSQDGQSRGMGHCTFQAASQAAAAIGFLRDRDVGGRPIWIAEDAPWTHESLLKLGEDNLGGGFEYILFSPLPGEMVHFDEYFSNGLKPPTSSPSQSISTFKFPGLHVVNSRLSSKKHLSPFWHGEIRILHEFLHKSVTNRGLNEPCHLQKALYKNTLTISHPITSQVKAASKPQIPAPTPVIPVPAHHSQPSYGITATPATGRIFFGNVPFEAWREIPAAFNRSPELTIWEDSNLHVATRCLMPLKWRTCPFLIWRAIGIGSSRLDQVQRCKKVCAIFETIHFLVGQWFELV